MTPQQRVADMYDGLRDLAGRFMSRERIDHTLQPTVLVHEVYLRFARDRSDEPLDHAETMTRAARIMREVLVDHARRRNALKRGGGMERLPFDSNCAVAEDRDLHLPALDDALSRLAEFDAEAARIIELRFFGGLTEEETARVMEVSARTVRRGWRSARLWLARELGEAPGR